MGGYTHYKWNHVSINWVDDAARRAFLLQLDIHEKMIPVQDKCLIFNRNDIGPYFGDGRADLYLSDNCGSNQDSCATFPRIYNHEIPKEYYNAQDGYKLMSGSSNSTFRVV